MATAVLLLAAAPPLQGQRVGDRVRLTTFGERVTGEVTEVGGDQIALRLGSGSPRRVALNDVERVEINTGTRRYGMRGFVIGAFTGLGLAAFTVLTDDSDDQLCEGDVDPAQCAVEVVVVGTGLEIGKTVMWVAYPIVFGAVGAVVGKLIKRSTWEAVPRGRLGAPTVDPLIGIRSGLDGGGPALVLGTKVRF